MAEWGGTLGLPADLPPANLLDSMPEFEVGERLPMMQPPPRVRPPSLDKTEGMTRPLAGLTQWMIKELREAKPHVEKWRNEAKQSYRFIAGKQFSDSDLTMMKSRGRAVAVFNFTQKFFKYVSGIQRRAPRAMLYLPLISDKQMQQDYAEYLTNASEWGLQTSRARFHHGTIFEDLLTGGMAWSDQFIDKHKDPGGLPGYKRLKPFEMVWPMNSNANLEGTRWRARQSDLPIDQAIRKWPEMRSYIMTITGQEDMQYPAREMPNIVRYVMPYIWAEPIQRISGGPATPKKDQAPITEFQWWEEEMGVYFYDEIQQADRWMPEKRFKLYRENVKEIAKVEIKEFDRVEKRTYWRTFMLADQYMLEMPKRLPTEDDFVFNCVTGAWNDHDKVFYGFVQALINPQEYANRYFNQLIEIIAYQGKGGLMYETDAIDEGQSKEAEMNWAKPGAWTRLKNGAISQNKVKEKTVGTLPEAAMAVMRFAKDSMEDVSGLAIQTFGTPASVGSGGSAAAGRQKMFAGLLLLAGDFDAFGEFLRKDAEIQMAHLKLLADNRLIAVGDPADPQMVQLMKTPFTTRMMVYLEESDMDPTAKQVWADQIMSIAPALIRTGNFLPEIFDQLMLPARFRNKLKQAIAQSAQQKQQMAEQGLGIPGRGKPRSKEEVAAHVQQMRTKAALDMARAQDLISRSRRDDLTSTLSGLLDYHNEQRARQQHSLEMAKGALDVFQTGMQPAQPPNPGA